jgi:hypothetical protein
MAVRPWIGKEYRALVQHIMRLPIWRGDWTKLGEKMDTASNIVHWNYTCEPVAIFDCPGHLVHQVIWLWLRLE